MELTLNDEDLSKLKASTRADIIRTFFGDPQRQVATADNSIDFDDVVDLDPDQVAEYMQGISDKYAAGLELIAKYGPKIHASLLDQVGITNHGHFQGRTTLRARTVTGDNDAFLLGWDDWGDSPNNGVGHYAVTDATFNSLRMYFQL